MRMEATLNGAWHNIDLEDTFFLTHFTMYTLIRKGTRPSVLILLEFDSQASRRSWRGLQIHLTFFCFVFCFLFLFSFFFLGHKSWKLWRHLCYWNRHNSGWRKSRAKRFKQIYWEHFWSEQWIYFLNKRCKKK